MNVPLLIVAVSLAAIGWTLVGYPTWLAIRARGTRSEDQGDSATRDRAGDALPTVTAVIPVHNGAPFLAKKLESVLSSDYPAERLNVIVLSDGSTDETDAIAESFAARERVRFVRLPKGGKAVALGVAFPMVDRDIVLLTDVRQRLEGDCVRNLVRRFSDPAVGVVSGQLRIRAGETAGEASTGLYWRYETAIREHLSRIDSIIGATGPIYAMRRTLVRPLPAGCILDDVWLPMQAVFDGYRAVMASDAVAWDYATSVSSEFARKVRTQAGLFQLLRLETRLLNPVRNRLFASFLFLKLGRLFLGHLLIVLAVASAFLPSPWSLLLLAMQAAFYAAVFVDRLLPEGSMLKRLTAPCATFVTLVAAAFVAQVVFFRDPSTLWKSTKVRLVDATS